MTTYRYPLPRRYRRTRYPYKFRSRKQDNGALPVVVITVGVLLASGAAAKGAVAVHSHAKPHAQAHAQPAHTVAAAVAVTSPSESAFIAATLADLGAPDTEANDRSFLGWFPHEYPSWPAWADNNPMSSTMPMPGSSAYNYLPGGGSVQNYPTAAEGAQATALTLNDGWYPSIVAALRSGDGLCGNQSVSAELLTWSGDGYSEVC